MSVKMALAKLCVAACGGAVVGGGAMHVASQPDARPANVYKAKKSAVRVARVYHKAPAKVVKRVRRVVTTSTACAIRSEQFVNGKRRFVMKRVPCGWIGWVPVARQPERRCRQRWPSGSSAWWPRTCGPR